MSERQAVDDFKIKYGGDYTALLEDVENVCEVLKRGKCKSMISDVYGRKGDRFKDSGKIAAKVRGKGKSVTIASCLELNDIVGLTIVAQYPDEITSIVKELRRPLKLKGIKLSKPELHENKAGYFATHVICTKMVGSDNINCEIQIKTPLHDAWAGKMHDLTYKPAGALDPRLSALMESVAVTLQSLENQSILIRNLIQAGWDIEAEARKMIREQFLGTMLEYSKDVWQDSLDSEMEKIYLEIERQSHFLANAKENDPQLTKIVRSIDKFCSDPKRVRQAWVMAGRIAMMRNRKEIVRSFGKNAELWLECAWGCLDEIDQKEISAVPLMFYVIGDVDLAIEYSARVQNNPKFVDLKSAVQLQIQFNEAAFLTEREYHAPTKNTAMRQALRERIETAIQRQMSVATEDLKSSINDTIGLVKITFGDTKEEVRSGIELCISAGRMAAHDEAAVSDAYMDLNMRLGWRRYFDLEARGDQPKNEKRVR